MNLISKIASFVCFSSIIISCGQPFSQEVIEDSSDLKGITATRFKCESFQSRIAGIQQKYGQYLKGGSASTRAAAFQSLSRLPDEYLEFTFTRFKTPITLQSGGGGVCYFGWTTIDGKRARRPNRITTSPYALNHEMGHGNAGVLELRSSTFGNERMSARNAVMGGGEVRFTSSYFRSYSDRGTQAEELYAEAFDSYYCSQQSRDYMKQNLPSVYAFAAKNFLPPVGTSGIGTATEELSGGIVTALEPANSSQNGDSYYMFLAMHSSVDESTVEYCLNTKEQCKSGAAWQKVQKTVALTSGLQTWVIPTRLQITAGAKVTIRGKVTTSNNAYTYVSMGFSQ